MLSSIIEVEAPEFVPVLAHVDLLFFTLPSQVMPLVVQRSLWRGAFRFSDCYTLGNACVSRLGLRGAHS